MHWVVAACRGCKVVIWVATVVLVGMGVLLQEALEDITWVIRMIITILLWPECQMILHVPAWHL